LFGGLREIPLIGESTLRFAHLFYARLSQISLTLFNSIHCEIRRAKDTAHKEKRYFRKKMSTKHIPPPQSQKSPTISRHSHLGSSPVGAGGKTRIGIGISHPSEKDGYTKGTNGAISLSSLYRLDLSRPVIHVLHHAYINIGEVRYLRSIISAALLNCCQA